MRFRSFSIALVAGLLALPLSARAVEISGTVRNGTTDGPVAGVPVTLLQHSAGNIVRVQDTTGVDGRYSIQIDEVPAGEVPILLSALYKEVSYAPVGEPGPDKPADITVYELTESDSAIALISHHIILDAGNGQGHHIYIFENRGNRTFRTGGGHGHGIEVMLPNGVTEFGAGPQGLHNHDQTVVDPRPVQPGRMQLSYSFALPVDGRLVQPVAHATESLDVLVTPPEVDVTPGKNLEDLGHVDIGDRHFRRLVGQNLAPGQEISLTLASVGQPAAPTGARPSAGASDVLSQDTLPWILGGAAVLFAALAIFYRSPGRARRGGGASDPEARRAALLQQMADLDDRLESGELTAEQHKSRREALKAEVVDLTNAIERGA